VKKPLVIESDGPAKVTPASAPPVPDAREPDLPAGSPEGRAMTRAAAFAARGGSRIGRFFWSAAASLLAFIASVATWRFIEGVFSANPLLGWIAAALFATFLVAALLLALREVAAYARLNRIDRLSRDAAAARAGADLATAQAVSDRLARLYRGRADQAWGLRRLAERRVDVLDADTLLDLTEGELMAPLDRAARAEVEASARQVAAVTAIVPLALADVAAALFANLRMLRRIAEIYGGRAGTFGSWRLMRRVMTHLVATGAVAVGDDLIHSMAGGGLLAKLSRRFGEGVINGALTARVGVAAMEVCRPMPFHALPRPRVTSLVSRGLAGLFSTGKGENS